MSYGCEFGESGSYRISVTVEKTNEQKKTVIVHPQCMHICFSFGNIYVPLD